ncbi:hypothetical protein BpHYR1_004467 [Brachionus plicatilis]|uniref:Uncharacterized protein n=1 Tax=Brachionus plicatilis TaxID=10195 RepID=A0A3M7S9S4_BRAPC|nr:hypothetical protein BpHYR1_004467 [Brachionus plicatilis]
MYKTKLKFIKLIEKNLFSNTRKKNSYVIGLAASNVYTMFFGCLGKRRYVFRIKSQFNSFTRQIVRRSLKLINQTILLTIFNFNSTLKAYKLNFSKKLFTPLKF